jgi:hypothetical protein
LGGYKQLKRIVTEKVKATEIINEVKIRICVAEVVLVSPRA